VQINQTAQILRWKDAESLSLAAAHFFVTECHRCIAEHGKFIVALSGGNTPKRLYQLLATIEFSRNIPWKKVFLFWSDERFVPHTDADSNYRMVKENLLDYISIPKKNIYPMPVKSSPKLGAAKYEASIKKIFADKEPVFDWLLLGVGEDGHIASLFPGTDILKKKKRLVKEVWVEQKQTWRISFTLPLINKAAQIIFMVTGKEKAAVIATALANKKTKLLLPVQLVQPGKGIIYWLLDDEAVSLKKNKMTL
jgi:6-phosphogluconolactonase